jgi:hypothetical protein
MRNDMSWTKSEKKLILIVAGILFLILNFASHFIIKSMLNVSIYEDRYDLEQERFIKKLGAKVHPFYGLSSANEVGFKSDISVENNFLSVSPLPEDEEKAIRVLVLGGSVASHLSLPRFNIPPYLFATKLNKYFDTDRFVVYNAAFGGGKQPQQFFKLIYLDLLGFKPDIIVNYDGFNEIALPFGENFKQRINAIYPREFNKLVTSSAYNGQCFGTNNFLLSMNTYMPILELTKWIYVRYCHIESTGEKLPSSEWNPKFLEEKQNYLQHTVNVWKQSSNKINEFSLDNGIPYLHFVQPNQYLKDSKPLSDLEEANFVNFAIYGDPIAMYYEKLNVSKLQTLTKYDHRYLFNREARTVYSDNCCHFNQLGMDIITDAIVSDALDEFKKLLNKK